MKVTTNNHWHELLALYELSDDVRAEFDYVGVEGGFTPRFFEYRGVWYDSHEFEFVTRALPELAGWDGFQSDSFYSGVVIRYAQDANDFDLEPYGWVQVGTATA